jgi:hypothetical protein
MHILTRLSHRTHISPRYIHVRLHAYTQMYMYLCTCMYYSPGCPIGPTSPRRPGRPVAHKWSQACACMCMYVYDTCLIMLACMYVSVWCMSYYAIAYMLHVLDHMNGMRVWRHTYACEHMNVHVRKICIHTRSWIMVYKSFITTQKKSGMCISRHTYVCKYAHQYMCVLCLTKISLSSRGSHTHTTSMNVHTHTHT